MSSTHKDERGIITDLLVTPEYSVTHITFTKGAVRGNHYHKATSQIDLVLKGELICVTEDERGRSTIIMHTGAKEIHLPEVAHAYKATRPSEMLSICFGVRRGEDYAKDTFKLKKPLI